MAESSYFKRLRRECEKISPYIRFVRIKMGFYRIYFKHAYIHEVYEDMPLIGFDIEDIDPRLSDKKYYEEYEDNIELTRKIKNYVEGYIDSKDRILKRIYMIRNNQEFAERAENAYKQITIK